MVRRGIVLGVLFFVVGAVPALAQSRVEISGFWGWAFSDGVTTDTSVTAGNGQVFNSVDPKSGQAYGFGIGFLAAESAEIGFLWTQQSSKLVLGGTSDLELGDLDLSTYHGYFAYNFGDPTGAAIRPFAFVGFGATSFSDVPVTLAGVDRTIPGEAQFSTTWGGGIKMFPTTHIGVRAAFQWTPTYIRTDSEGWWCDPFWGCYLVGDAQYVNQFQINGGVTVRF